MNPVPVAAVPVPEKKNPPAVPEVMTVRKGCRADGVGLSHFILVEPGKK